MRREQETAETYGINVVCMGNYANSASLAAHWLDLCPLVGFWVVILTSLVVVYPIETTANINLLEQKDNYIA